MNNKYKKQSWIMILILAVITFGIYIPFWYKKIKTVTDENELPEKLNQSYINIALTFSFVNLPLNLLGSITVNGASLIDNLFFGLLNIGFGIAVAVLVLLLRFNLRDILQKELHTNINPVVTFFFGELYLQYKINQHIDSTN